MQIIPAELKYSQCCLKCKLVDAPVTAHQVSGTSRTFNECKKCGGFVTSYDEHNTRGKTLVLVTLMLLGVIYYAGIQTETNMDYIYTAHTILCCIFGLVWFWNRSLTKRLENLLKKHVENKL